MDCKTIKTHICLIFFVTLLSCSIPTRQITDPYLVILGTISESMSAVDSYDGEVRFNVAQTGQSPNQIMDYKGEIFVVNSLSNSITVYDKKALGLKREFSTGDSTNPYKMLVYNDMIYVTAYCTHEVIVLDLKGKIKTHISLDKSGSYFAYPEGIARYGDVIFVACKDSLEESAGSCNPNGGRVAVIQNDAVIRYIPTGAADTSNVFVVGDMLYIISSGVHQGGFMENGKIECIDLTKGLENVELQTVADGNSFGVCRIVGEYAYCGNLGNGSLMCYDISVRPWNLLTKKVFDGNGSLAFISDIVYDNNRDCLYVLEFNANELYKIEPVTLNTVSQKKCSDSNNGDAQGLLLTE